MSLVLSNVTVDITNNENFTIPAGTNFTLNCSGRNVTWKPVENDNSKIVQNGKNVSHLQIINSNVNNTGSYECFNQDDLFTSVYFFVDDGEHLLVPVDSNELIIDGNVTVPCRVTNPNAQVVLFDNEDENKTINYEYDPRSGFLILEENVFHHESVSCKAHHKNISETLSFELLHKPFLSKPEINGSRVILKTEGDTIHLLCSVLKEFHATHYLRWQLPNSKQPNQTSGVYTVRDCDMDSHIPNRCSRENIKLTIMSAKKEDEGNYTCSVSANGAHANSNYVELKVFGKGESVLEIETKEKVIASVNDSEATIAATYGSSAGLPLFHWILPNKSEIKNSSKYKITTTAKQVILTINYLTKSDAGTYVLICQAGTNIEKRNISLLLRGPPSATLEVNGSNIQYLYSDSYTFNCKINSYPYGNVSWLFQNCTSKTNCSEKVLLLKEERKRLASYTGAIDVVAFTSGRIICLVQNRLGRVDDSQYIFITEKYQPYFKSEINTNSYNISKETPVHFDCEADGIPKPEIRWYKEKHKLGPMYSRNNSGNKSIITFSKDMKVMAIKSTSLEDSGKYVCLVNNSEGEIQRSFNLKVAEHGAEFLSPPTENSMTITVISVVLVLLIAAVVFLFMRNVRERKKLKSFTIKEVAEFLDGTPIMFNPELEADEVASLLPYNKLYEFPLNRLEFDKEIGNGAFGRVVKAEAKGIKEGEAATTVAVKMVKSHCDVQHIRALMTELKILMYVGHHLNVLNLLGACTANLIEKELYVVLEYCRYGNIRSYLQRHRKSFVNQVDPVTGCMDASVGVENMNYAQRSPVSHKKNSCVSSNESTVVIRNSTNESQCMTFTGETCSTFVEDNSSFDCTKPKLGTIYNCDSNESTPLNTLDLWSWSYQIALAMDYLSGHKIVHADLAARNILLTDYNIVKICDFGLSRRLYEKLDYLKKGEDPLPIKWMAIESLEDKVFSIKTDVWSFGIVLWEIFSLGKTPYPGMGINETFLEKLRQGYRMAKPNFCPDEIYRVMLQCWEAESKKRPNFSDLAGSIGEMLDDKLIEQYNEWNIPYINQNAMQKTYANWNTEESVYILPEKIYENSGYNSCSMEEELGDVINGNVQRGICALEESEYLPMSKSSSSYDAADVSL